MFPFSNISNEDLIDIINPDDTFDQEVTESLDPLLVQDDNYNNDLDVNQFYIRSRHINFHKSEYIFLEKISSLFINSDFNILTFNIRSISTNFQYFKDTMLSDNISYDVLGFTETRLDADISPLYTLPSHEMFTNNRNKYGGGVAVYVSKRYSGYKVNEFNRMETFIESVGVELKLNDKLVLLLCIYRPPQGNVNSFLNALNEILSNSHDI